MDNEKRQLISYYSSLHFALKDSRCREAIRYVSAAPNDFFKELAVTLKVKLTDILSLFKNFKIVKFFSMIGWSFKNLFEKLKKGYYELKLMVGLFQQFVEDSKIVRVGTDTLKKFDDWLKDHPKADGIIKAGLSISLVFIYFVMSDTGDPAYDFDFTDILKAMHGSITFAEVFGGNAGVKLFSLFITGAILKISFPWSSFKNFSFMLGVVATLAKAVGQKLSKGSDKELLIASFI